MTVNIDTTNGNWELSKGVNIEGLARQRDLNKLAEQLVDRMEALEKIVTVNEVHTEFGYTVRCEHPVAMLTRTDVLKLNEFAQDQYLLGTDVETVEEELGNLANSLINESIIDGLNNTAFRRQFQRLNEETCCKCCCK